MVSDNLDPIVRATWISTRSRNRTSTISRSPGIPRGRRFNLIVVDDVVYVYGRNGSLIALNASTGKEIWIHEGLNGMASRGINYWQAEDGKERRLLFSINSFLQAVDARTGLSIPTFGVDGIVDLRAELLRGDKMGWNNNSAGKVWRNLLILGSTTGEAFISPPGDIRA